jgi:hypothetical protein
MSYEKEFAKGLYVKPPKEGAPDWVKFKMSIKREEVIHWLQGQTDEWINTEVKEGKSGKWYAEVWKPDPSKARVASPQQNYASPSALPQDDFADDIPF